MAPEPQNLNVEVPNFGIKMRFVQHKFKDSNALKVCENNNTVTEDAGEKTNSDKDFDISKYEAMEFRPSIKWPDLLVQLTLHLVTIYGLLLIITNSVKFYTIIFAFATIFVSGFGITAGVHRLWSHRAYRAKLPLRIILALLFTITGQRDIYTWALDHRVHHKYSETVADPHDVRRGFWFAHVGWLVLTPHPAVENRRAALRSASVDLLADPVVKIQKNFAHLWGNKPYDRFIKPTENILVSIAALGEGWHNYHHVFPWDYRTSELGRFNLSTKFIDLFSKIGWAYDLKAAAPSIIIQKALRCGDGSLTEEESDIDFNPLQKLCNSK